MVRAKKSGSKTAKLATKLYLKPKSVKALPAPDPPKFETLNVDKSQCKKAVDALVLHAKQKIQETSKTDLLAGEENEAIWVGVVLKQMSPRESQKPIRLPLPNPLMDPRKNPVCLIVKDPQREYKDLLEEKKIKFINRVVGLEKLQGKFKPFEARRELMKDHDLFLVDDRIALEMPRVLGKNWLQAKKSPIPVTLSRGDLKGELERAISSTYMRINKGTTLSVKIGSLDSHNPQQLVENLVAVIPHLAVKIPMGGWDNVQALHIKTNSSVALPIWTSSLGLDGAEDKSSRFYTPAVNEEEVEAKRAAKAEKNKRIQGKKEKRLSIEGLSDLSDEDDEGDESIANESGEASAVLEEIDETVKSKPSPAKASPKKHIKKAEKGAASPAGSERKKVSSTTKRLKGMDDVKGYPRKAKKA